MFVPPLCSFPLLTPRRTLTDPFLYSDGVETPEKIDYVSKAEEAASKATEKVAEKVADKIKEAAEVVKTVVADSDDAGQEHNEL